MPQEDHYIDFLVCLYPFRKHNPYLSPSPLLVTSSPKVKMLSDRIRDKQTNRQNTQQLWLTKEKKEQRWRLCKGAYQIKGYGSRGNKLLR